MNRSIFIYTCLLTLIVSIVLTAVIGNPYTADVAIMIDLDKEPLAYVTPDASMVAAEATRVTDQAIAEIRYCIEEKSVGNPIEVIILFDKGPGKNACNWFRPDSKEAGHQWWYTPMAADDEEDLIIPEGCTAQITRYNWVERNNTLDPNPTEVVTTVPSGTTVRKENGSTDEIVLLCPSF